MPVFVFSGHTATLNSILSLSEEDDDVDNEGELHLEFDDIDCKGESHLDGREFSFSMRI